MSAYLFFKWLHIVAVISWMAGILYLYRLLVNHAENLTVDANHRLLSDMERRLYKIITVPAMIVSFVAGIAMVIALPEVAKGSWFAIKFVLVLVLAAATGYAGKTSRKFAARQETLPSSKTLRYLNEVPTVLMILIVGLVVFKPFS